MRICTGCHAEAVAKRIVGGAAVQRDGAGAIRPSWGTRSGGPGGSPVTAAELLTARDGVAFRIRVDVITKGGFDVGSGRRPGLFPHAPICTFEQRPDKLSSVLERVHVVRERRKDHDVVRDATTGLVLTALRIGEPHCHDGADSSAHLPLALRPRECTFVGGERVSIATVEEEPEAPGSSACRPDEPHFMLLTSRWSSTPRSRSSLNWVRTAVR